MEATLTSCSTSTMTAKTAGGGTHWDFNHVSNTKPEKRNGRGDKKMKIREAEK